MAHFAQLDENNIVIDVHVVDNVKIHFLEFPASEPVGIKYLKSIFGEDTKWKQTSYNENFRVRYAGIDYKYDEKYDAFIPPSPFPSWIFDENVLLYEPPIPYPEDGNEYEWDEDTLTWKPYEEFY